MKAAWKIILGATLFAGTFAMSSCSPAKNAAPAKPVYSSGIAYLGAAWGPDGDTIYFIKLIDSPDRHYWLCKMKWDGTEKKEISELWAGQNALVIIQGGPLWMEVNGVTSNVAFSVEYGNEVAFGLWIVGLDGKNLRRPFPLVWNAQAKWAPLHPSWSPDGTKIVYEEDDRTGPVISTMRLALYDFQKKERTQLTEEPHDQHPVWSPKGDWIAFTHYIRLDNIYAKRRIWLIRPNGNDARPVVDEKGEAVKGWWPSWNQEGTKISINDGLLRIASLSPTEVKWIDPLPILGERMPYTFMGHHWGRHGWLLSTGSIRLINPDKNSARMLAKAGIYKFTDPQNDEARWGSAPYEIPVRAEK